MAGLSVWPFTADFLRPPSRPLTVRSLALTAAGSPADVRQDSGSTSTATTPAIDYWGALLADELGLTTKTPFVSTLEVVLPSSSAAALRVGLRTGSHVLVDMPAASLLSPAFIAQYSTSVQQPAVLQPAAGHAGQGGGANTSAAHGGAAQRGRRRRRGLAVLSVPRRTAASPNPECHGRCLSVAVTADGLLLIVADEATYGEVRRGAVRACVCVNGVV
jgi:hypothetical protein